jgi:cell wall-associated NlpC family hydrolase
MREADKHRVSKGLSPASGSLYAVGMRWSVVLLIALLVTGCAARARAPRGVAGPTPSGERAAASARSLVGAPYRNGGTTPEGFDCSGFVQYIFRGVGIDLPRSVPEQFEVGSRVGRDRLRRGDLVFFAIDGRAVSHVGIVVDEDRFVHAPSSRGRVREESLSVEYWRSRFAGGRRVTGR